MLSSLLRRLTNPDASPLAQEDARIAIAALLVSAAHADGGVREAHEDQLMRRVTDLLGVDPRDGHAARQRAQAEG